MNLSGAQTSFGPWMIGLIVIGSICLTLALLYLVEASRRPQDGTRHLLFGLVALAAAANAFIEPWAYRSATVEQYRIALKSHLPATSTRLWCG